MDVTPSLFFTLIPELLVYGQNYLMVFLFFLQIQPRCKQTFGKFFYLIQFLLHFIINKAKRIILKKKIVAEIKVLLYLK